MNNKKSSDAIIATLITPEFLKPVGLPGKLETIDGVVRTADTPAAAAQMVDTQTYLQTAAKEWADAVADPARRAEAIKALATIVRISRISFTGSSFIPREARPTNSEQIISCCDAVFKTVPFISEDARFILRGLALDEAMRTRKLLADCYEARSATTAYDGDMDAMIAGCENFLDRFVRLFDQRVTALVESDREVATRLAPLDVMIRGGAQKAEVTRALTDRVAAQTEADTLARVAAQQAAAAAAAPSGATPPIVIMPQTAVAPPAAPPPPVAPKSGARRIK